MSSKSRRYVSKDYASAPLFLVNRLNEGSLTSEGPFTDIEKAEDMIIEVLSYLDMSDIIKLDLSFDCFKKYLVLRLKNKEYNSYKNIWYKGVYNNQYNIM